MTYAYYFLSYGFTYGSLLAQGLSIDLSVEKTTVQYNDYVKKCILIYVVK